MSFEMSVINRDMFTKREKMWERVVSEDQMIPNADALKLHWQRCCWVFSYWKQTLKNIMTLSPLTENG
jgi:hypothetical protein